MCTEAPIYWCLIKIYNNIQGVGLVVFLIQDVMTFTGFAFAKNKFKKHLERRPVMMNDIQLESLPMGGDFNG